MTAEREIDYEALAQSAMRGIVRTVLARVAKSGLPGEHHFYIAFKTDASGVIISKRLKEKYPEEMTVVLQHRFWDLLVNEERFEVKLTFDSIPERLSVPFDAIKVFFDPSVPYGLQFEEFDSAGLPQGGIAVGQDKTANAKGQADKEEPAATERRAEKKPRAPRRLQPEKTAERPAETSAATKPAAKPAPAPVKSGEPPPPTGPKVVSIDAFRKK
jgi:uncharacterized protein